MCEERSLQACPADAPKPFTTIRETKVKRKGLASRVRKGQKQKDRVRGKPKQHLAKYFDVACVIWFLFLEIFEGKGSSLGLGFYKLRVGFLGFDKLLMGF